MKFILAILIMAASLSAANAQSIADSCLATIPEPATTFSATNDLFSYNSDLLEWNGSAWLGGWPNANVNLPPPTGNVGCRVIFMGDPDLWTTGGEGVAYRLTSPLVAGVNYSFPFTTISHGAYSDAAGFSPSVHTATDPLAAWSPVGMLPPGGTTWTNVTLTFTATAAQNGHDWLILHTGPSGSTGLVSSHCSSCTTIEPECNVDLGPDVTICEGDTLLVDVSLPDASYLWNDGSTSPVHDLGTAGTYWVTVIVEECVDSDTISVSTVNIPENILGNDTSICAGTLMELDAFFEGAEYLWNNGSTGATLTTGTEGTYTVQLSIGQCVRIDTFQLSVIGDIPDLGPDVTLCPGESITIDASHPDAIITWHDGLSDPVRTFDGAGTIWLQWTFGDCSARDTLQLFQVDASALLPDDAYFCEGGSELLDATMPGASYLWSTGTTNAQLSVSQPGLYWVEVTITGCTMRDSVQVSEVAPPIADLGGDTTLCAGAGMMLSAGTTGPYAYLWNTGQTTATIQVELPGTYHVTMSAGDCVAADTIDIAMEECIVVIEMPNIFTPNNDGHNDGFRPIVHLGGGSPVMTIYNRWGTVVQESTDLDKGWNGRSSGELVPDGTYFWVIEYSDRNKERTSLHGSVTLLR